MDAFAQNYSGIRNPYARERKIDAHHGADSDQGASGPSLEAALLLEEAFELPSHDVSEEEIRQAARLSRERKQTQAQALALEYTLALELDPQSAEGRAWTEKTAAFYARNDELLGRLRGLVEQARRSETVQ
jgi:hypothetical protein